MRKLRRLISVALFASLLLLFIATNSLAQIADSQRGSLKGWGLDYPITVQIEEINPKFGQYGLTESQIQTDVELRLRKAGVPVKSKRSDGISSYPQLYLEFNAWDSDGLYAFHISLQAIDAVDLHRKPPRLALAIIWENNSLGRVGENRLRDLRGEVADLVDGLINDYLAANPKR